MGRHRTRNRHLPARVYESRGWLFYVDPGGTWHRLGKQWDRAAKDEWIRLTTGRAPEGTVSGLLDVFLTHTEALVRQGKRAMRTLDGNLTEAQSLKLVFGRMPYAAVTSKHIKSYLNRRTDKDGKPAPVRANREIALLSSAYAWAMGEPCFDVTVNPCYGVRRNPERSRERCPELWELEAVKEKASEAWRAIIDAAYITGQRGQSLRLLRKDQLREDGIDFGVTKRGKHVFVEWDADLRACIARLTAIGDEIAKRTHLTSTHVIVNRHGQPYSAAGWKSNFYKFVRAALGDKENALQEAFHFHDIRARSATDDELSAQHRLGHRTRSQTDDYLRSKRVVRVKPLPLKRSAA